MIHQSRPGSTSVVSYAEPAPAAASHVRCALRRSVPTPVGPMKTSVIRHRVADFLKSHAPFDVLSEQDLLDLAGSGRVKFHESEEYLFRQGDAKGQFVWMIQQGRVELLEESASGEQLRNVLGEGDLLGLERFAGDGSYLFSARTATDAILYGVAGAQFDSVVPRY